MPFNFSLSFDLTPLGAAPANMANILHFSKTSINTDRGPAVYFQAKSTKLMVRISSPSNTDSFLITEDLAVNATTRVTIEVVGTHCIVWLNGKISNYMGVAGIRSSGLGNLYVSNPWSPPANAVIGNIALSDITNFKVSDSISSISGIPSKLGLITSQIMPFNYSLGFDLTPLGTSNQWTNIFHFSQTNTDSSRMPGVWTVPGTTKLHIRVGKEEQPNDGIIETLPLPLNAKTNVVIEVINNRV
jgi:hypothetical protein